MITFRALARQKTQTSILDSGSYYGYGWQKPPVPEDAPLIKKWLADEPALIETSTLLDEYYTIDQKLSEAVCEHYVGSDSDKFETSIKAILAPLGFVKVADGYTYNACPDLSEDFMYQIWLHEDGNEDWIYDVEHTVTVIRMHTGCDARLGFTPPVVCVRRGDYAHIPSITASYTIENARKYKRHKFRRPWREDTLFPDPCPDMNEGVANIPDEQLRSLCEKCDTHYDSEPYYRLKEDVSRWFEFTRTRDTVCVQLKTGEICKVRAYVCSS